MAFIHYGPQTLAIFKTHYVCNFQITIWLPLTKKCHMPDISTNRSDAKVSNDDQMHSYLEFL